MRLFFEPAVEADLSFRDFLASVKSTVLGALAHSEIPFDAIVRELAPKRDSSRHPLVPSSVLDAAALHRFSGRLGPHRHGGLTAALPVSTFSSNFPSTPTV